MIKIKSNQELVKAMIDIGNNTENVRITGKTKEERFKKFMEILNGECSKNTSKGITKQVI